MNPGLATIEQQPTSTVTNRLDAFLPDNGADRSPVVVLSADHPMGGDQPDRGIVVLARRDDGLIEVWHEEAITALSAATAVLPVTDSDRCERALRAAVTAVAATGSQHRADANAATIAHERTLDQMRDYAITEFVEGPICRAGLDDFLTYIGVRPYAGQRRVSYTITGSFVVDRDDSDDTHYDARAYLRPDLEDISYLVEDSDTFSVTIDDVEAVTS